MEESSLIQSILSKKDLATESLLNCIIQEETEALSKNLSADERQNALIKKTQERLLEISTQLFIKLAPSVKTLFSEANQFNSDLVCINIPAMDSKQKALLYLRMFNAIVDCPLTTSFNVINKRHLGNLSAKDLFILTFYAIVHCKRVKYDSLLQLYISGISSCGKSSIFESVILQNCHNFVTSYGSRSSGVGRFNTNNRSILFLHDISIRSLLSSTDLETLKAICRAEIVAAKTFGATCIVEPMFVVCTSNERLMKHTVYDTSKWPILLESDAEQLKKYQSGGQKSHLTAVQSRYIECTIFKRPSQLEDDIQSGSGFIKQDCTIGLFRKILDLMSKYNASDFASVYLYNYVIHALLKNASLYMNLFEADDVLPELNNLCAKYNIVKD